MKVKVLKTITNKGILEPFEYRRQKEKYRWVNIKKGRFEIDSISHPLRLGNDCFYKRMHGLKYKKKRIYWLQFFAKPLSQNGCHVGFNWWQHQVFLWLQKDHWFQKESNIRYLINIVFLILGVIIGFKQLG